MGLWWVVIWGAREMVRSAWVFGDVDGIIHFLL